ncbi:MAG: radical SAM protein [Planctomycetes bacterium]|nr:radical SAM protein [Planctomycetota bacterium]
MIKQAFNRFLDYNWANIWNTIYRIKGKAGLLPQPEEVQWLTTGRCNLSCAHCGTNAGHKSEDELTTREIKQAIDELALMGTKLLELTGGEPLLREDLWEVLHYAKEQGIKYSLVTNGAYVPRYEKELKALPPAAVKVSVDGIPKTHNGLRGADNFDACMQALKFFEGLNIGTRVLCTTLNQRNFQELEELFLHVRASSANYWEFHLCVREGRAKTNQDWMYLDKNQIKQLFRFILANKNVFNIFMGESCGYIGSYTRRLYDHRFFCGCGWRTFTIMPNGNIAGCPAFETQWTEGNLRQKSLRWLWQNRFERFRQQTDLTDDCRKCDYLPACGGGCWMMRRTGDHCYKEIWENGL